MTGTYGTFLSWRAVFSGFFISLLIFLILMSLGMALGGISLQDLDGMEAFGWGAAIWTIASISIALFFGSMAASRVSNFVSSGVGVVQGLTVAAVFVTLLFWSAGMFAGLVGNAISGITHSTAAASVNFSQLVTQVYQNEEVQSTLREKLVELGIQPGQVDQIAVGVISRLLAGNREAAENFLAMHSSVEPRELQLKLAEIENRAIQVAQNIAEGTAKAFSVAGWFIFFMLLISTGFSMLGGLAGVRRNAKHSLPEREVPFAA